MSSSSCKPVLSGRVMLSLLGGLAAMPLLHAETAVSVTPVPVTAPIAAAPKVQTLSTITITANRNTAPEEVSAIAKTVISQAEMLRYGDASVTDALRRATGIQMGATGGAGRAQFRGSTAAPTILVNGEAVQGGRRGGSSLIDTFTPEMIDRIEVTRQASVTQGSVAAGGVINIILKDPRAGTLGGVVKLGYGEVTQGEQSQQQRQLNLQLDGKREQLGYSLSANQSRTDSTSQTELTRADGQITLQRQQSEGEFKMLAPRLQYELEDDYDSKLFADAFYNEHATTNQSSSQSGSQTNSTQQQTDSDSTRLNLRLEQQHGEREDKWRISAQQQNEQQATLSNSAGQATLRLVDEQTREWSAGYAGSQKIGEAHQVKFGAELRQTNLNSNVDAELTEKRQAVYLEESWKLNEKNTITAGLRQEWLKRSGLVDYQQDSLSPALAYRYQYDPAWSVQIGYSQSQRTPRSDDLLPTVTASTSLDAGSLNNPDQGGNPNLKPEQIQSVESTLGYNSEAGGFNLTVFRRNIDDYIEKVVSLESGRYVERPQNQAEALASGVELSARWALRNQNGHSLLLNGQISTIRAEIQRAGQADRLASNVAPYSSSIGLSYQYQPLKWSTNLNIGYQPSYRRPLDDQPYIRDVNARTTLDISSTKRFDQGWAVTVSGRNLLAAERIERLTTPDGGFFQQRRAESLPNVLLTLEKRF
ncbi:MAG: TonB-dependent receptor [Moraxellaceae bacterium]